MIWAGEEWFILCGGVNGIVAWRFNRTLSTLNETVQLGFRRVFCHSIVPFATREPNSRFVSVKTCHRCMVMHAEWLERHPAVSLSAWCNHRHLIYNSVGATDVQVSPGWRHNLFLRLNCCLLTQSHKSAVLWLVPKGGLKNEVGINRHKQVQVCQSSNLKRRTSLRSHDKSKHTCIIVYIYIYMYM